MPETLHDSTFDAEAEDRRNDELYLKYRFDGTPSIAALADALRALAADVGSRAADGWYLAGPVEGGWAHLAKRGHDA